MTNRRKGRMGNLGDEAFRNTDRELADREAEILMVTTIDWEELRPRVGDSELYDQLIAAVDDATQKNIAVAKLKQRIDALGKEGIQLARKIIDLAS